MPTAISTQQISGREILDYVRVRLSAIRTHDPNAEGQLPGSLGAHLEGMRRRRRLRRSGDRWLHREPRRGISANWWADLGIPTIREAVHIRRILEPCTRVICSTDALRFVARTIVTGKSEISRRDATRVLAIPMGIGIDVGVPMIGDPSMAMISHRRNASTSFSRLTH